MWTYSHFWAVNVYQSNRVQWINTYDNHKNTSGNWHNGNMTCCVFCFLLGKITAKHQAVLFLHNYRPGSSEWCLARAEKDLRGPMNALSWSQRFHFYNWMKYIPNHYNWWASVPMDEIVLIYSSMNMEKVGIPWIQTCLKDRWFSYMFLLRFRWGWCFFLMKLYCIQQQQGHKVCFPPVSPAEGKNLPFLGVDLGWSKVVNFKDQILYDFVTRREFNLEKRDMMEGMLKDWNKGWVFLERRSFISYMNAYTEQATLKALRSLHICIWLYDYVFFIWIVPMFATVGISIKCVMSCTIILLWSLEMPIHLKLAFGRKHMFAVPHCEGATVHDPFTHGQEILHCFPLGLLAWKMQLHPSFQVVFPFLNYSAAWWLWIMFLKHDDLNFRRNIAHKKSHVWNWSAWSAILPGMYTRREASLQEIRCPNGRQMDDMERRGSKLVCLGQQHWCDPEAFTCFFFSWKFGMHLYPFIIVHPFENKHLAPANHPENEHHLPSTFIFGFHVSFRGCSVKTSNRMWIQKKRTEPLGLFFKLIVWKASRKSCLSLGWGKLQIILGNDLGTKIGAQNNHLRKMIAD